MMPQTRHNVLFLRGLRDDGVVQAIRVIDNNRLVYNCEGSCNVFDHIESSAFTRTLITLDHNPAQNLNIPDAALVFNQISDADSHRISLTKAARLLASLKTPLSCINHPERIARLTRDYLSRALPEKNGLIVPETVRLKRGSREAIRRLIDAGDIAYPFIVRLCGRHGGHSMKRVEDESGLAELGAEYHENECYLTRFIDYVDDRGIYAKYRLAVIEGEPFLRHLIYSDDWNIHSGSRSRFMKNNSWYFDYEKQAIEKFETDLKPGIREAVERIHKTLELEYFGIDCAITPANELIVFEANANMNILINTSDTPNMWEAPIQAIRNRIETMIHSRLPA